MQRERFAVLDGLRGICAVLVALYHLRGNGYLFDVPFVQNAWLFVDLFFVLSGFVITHAYLDRLGRWNETRGFIIRRFGRVWPLHVAVLGLLVALELSKLALTTWGGIAADHPAFSDERTSLVSIATNIVMIHSLGVHDTDTWNFPSWSISTEFYTYVVFAALLMVVRTSRARVVAAVLTALASVSVVILFSRQGMAVTYDYGFFRCLCGFFVGHLCYRLWRWRCERGRPATGALAEFGAIGTVMVFVSLAGEDALSFASPLVFGAVVFVFADESGPVSKLLSSRWIALIGAWSYSIYMVHVVVIQMLVRVLKYSQKFTGIPLTITTSVSHPLPSISYGSRWGMDLVAVGYLMLVIVVAAATYRLIEQPGRRLFNRLAEMRRRSVPLAGVAIPTIGSAALAREHGAPTSGSVSN